MTEVRKSLPPIRTAVDQAIRSAMRPPKCWLLHWWGQWSDVDERKTYRETSIVDMWARALSMGVYDREPRPQITQERRCLRCNKVQLRVAHT